MNEKKYTALIIDDHPLIADAYKNAFTYIENNEDISFTVHLANDCDSAYQIVHHHHSNNLEIDVIFLDISLPPSKDGKLLSGEDVGLKINDLLPNSKIIVSTTFNDNYRIHSIFKNINPDGFLIKNEITPKELVSSINTILTDPPYYSKTVLNLLRKQLSNDFVIDTIDRTILYELSIGAKTKDLPNVVHLSIKAIEKRKRRLKEIFNMKSSDDKELILAAKERGFI